MVCKNSVLDSFAKIHKKASMSEFFIKKYYWLIKNKLQHRCFPVNFDKFLRTPILKTFCKWL